MVELTQRVRKVLLIALLVMALDQASKAWLLYELGMIDGRRVVITDFFSLVMVWNHGVSFGMLAHAHDWMPYLLIVLALGVSAALFRLALRSESRLERIGFAMVVGGAIGNAIDRVRVGAVADFFYFHLGDLGWPAFNVADASICIGVGLVMIYLLTHRPRA